MPYGDLATLNPDEVIDRIAAGEYQSHIARELKVAPQSLHERISKHPRYRQALECRNQAMLDDAQVCIDQSPDVGRAREAFRAAAWRAERECPDVWGAKSQVNVTATVLSISADLSSDALSLLDCVAETPNAALLPVISSEDGE